MSNRTYIWFGIFKTENIDSNELHTKSLYAYDSKWKFLMQSTIFSFISDISESDFILSENISIRPDRPKLWPLIWKHINFVLKKLQLSKKTYVDINICINLSVNVNKVLYICISGGIIEISQRGLTKDWFHNIFIIFWIIFKESLLKTLTYKNFCRLTWFVTIRNKSLW